MEKRITLILAVSGLLSLSILFSQNAFAQSSAIFETFQTGNASDDECFVATRTGGTTWLGCFATSSTVLRINAMSGNSTIATTTVSAVQPVGGQEVFFGLDATTIVYVDTSGANEVVRKYQISGSTITNTQSLTLTGCASANSPPNSVGTTLVYVCQDGGIRLVNMNSMVLENTFTNVEQGNCTTVNGVVLISGLAKGMAWCDSTELYLFTVNAQVITHTDELTGLDSNAVKKGLITQEVAWLAPRDGTSEMQFAGVDTQSMTFTTGIQSLPTQATIVHFDVAGRYLLTLDSTDDNILVYDMMQTQPSVALANFSVPNMDITDRAYIISTDAGANFVITTSVSNTGRYYIMSDIIIDGEPVTDDTPDDPFDTGIDCSLPANEHKLICNIPGGGGIETNLGNATGRGLLLLGCTIVFVVCEDTNPQTNGMGLLAFIASLFVIVGMFYYVLGTDRVANIPLFIWIIIVIALSAFFTLAGWIDPVFLIISIVAVIALAAPKLISVIRGGNTMGGGSTE